MGQKGPAPVAWDQWGRGVMVSHSMVHGEIQPPSKQETELAALVGIKTKCLGARRSLCCLAGRGENLMFFFRDSLSLKCLFFIFMSHLEWAKDTGIVIMTPGGTQGPEGHVGLSCVKGEELGHDPGWFT